MLLKYYNNIKNAKNKQLVFVQSWHNHMSDVFPDDYIMIRLAVAPTGRFCEKCRIWSSIGEVADNVPSKFGKTEGSYEDLDLLFLLKWT